MEMILHGSARDSKPVGGQGGSLYSRIVDSEVRYRWSYGRCHLQEGLRSSDGDCSPLPPRGTPNSFASILNSRIADRESVVARVSCLRRPTAVRALSVSSPRFNLHSTIRICFGCPDTWCVHSDPTLHDCQFGFRHWPPFLIHICSYLSRPMYTPALRPGVDSWFVVTVRLRGTSWCAVGRHFLVRWVRVIVYEYYSLRRWYELHVFLEYEDSMFASAPGPFGDRGDTARWGLMAGSVACCATYTRRCPFGPCTCSPWSSQPQPCGSGGDTTQSEDTKEGP